MKSDYTPTYHLDDERGRVRERDMTMQGYLRADGRKGIRNMVVVGYLVECAHHVAREIALPFRDRDVHVIGFPGCYPELATPSR